MLNCAAAVFNWKALLANSEVFSQIGSVTQHEKISLHSGAKCNDYPVIYLLADLLHIFWLFLAIGFNMCTPLLRNSEIL